MKTIEDYNVKDWHEATKEGKYVLFFHADWCQIVNLLNQSFQN